MEHNELQNLREKCLQCTSCINLYPKRNNVVFGSGNEESPLVLVGEGPGEQEDFEGIPFVGRAGKLLEQALKDNNLSRDDVYITNTVKCRACNWENNKAINRPPTEEESNNCRKWLIPQLEIIRPEVILCIGAPSAKNLIKKNFKITQERGIYFPSQFSRCIMATLHPSYILRNGGTENKEMYGLIVKDIAKAYQAANKLKEKWHNKCIEEPNSGTLF